jgi:CheY-like chemotaxis protein
MFGAAPAQLAAPALDNRNNLRGNVLVVEDNPTNQKVIVLRLQKLGCSVELAQNGEEAVQAASKTSFDAILMDCQMPVLDGFEATAQIRAKGGRHVPIIALTANAMDGERERCLDAGMDDYLSKPVRAEELFKTLNYWLGEKWVIGARTESAAATGFGVREALRQFTASMAEEGIGRDDVVILFESLLETNAKLITDLQASIEQEDGRLLAMAAHTLKGSFANFGLTSLANLAAVLEKAGENQRWDGAGGTLTQVLSEYREARDTIEEMARVPAS